MPDATEPMTMIEPPLTFIRGTAAPRTKKALSSVTLIDLRQSASEVSSIVP